MKKINFLLTLLVISSFCIKTYADETETSNQIRIGLLNGPSAVPSAKLMCDSSTKTYISDFSIFADPKALLPKLIKKEVDVGFLPVNVAVKVYNSTNGSVLCAAITGNGNLFIISSEHDVKRFADLDNKTVSVAGQGSTPEYMFKYLLEQNNVHNCKFDFSLPTNQIVPNLIAGKIKYAVIPEPFVSIAILKSNKIKVILDLQKEFSELNSDINNYPMTVMVVRKEFAENNSELFGVFLDDYKNAVEWTIKNPKSSGQLVEKCELALSAQIVTKSIPKTSYVFVRANEGKNEIESLLKIFLNNASQSIGGVLPDSTFYY